MIYSNTHFTQEYYAALSEVNVTTAAHHTRKQGTQNTHRNTVLVVQLFSHQHASEVQTSPGVL